MIISLILIAIATAFFSAYEKEKSDSQLNENAERCGIINRIKRAIGREKEEETEEKS